MVKSICRWQVSNTPDLAYAKIYANLAQFLKQCRASFQYILPCGFKISREPWVCHFTGMIRMQTTTARLQEKLLKPEVRQKGKEQVKEKARDSVLQLLNRLQAEQGQNKPTAQPRKQEGHSEI